jgi:Na+-transporting methylmalonyl-CoA/oxaloacetate decarboxylase gamma subunit
MTTVLIAAAIVAALLILAFLAMGSLAGRFADAAEGQVYGTTDPEEIARQRAADRDHLAAVALATASHERLSYADRDPVAYVHYAAHGDTAGWEDYQDGMRFAETIEVEEIVTGVCGSCLAGGQTKCGGPLCWRNPAPEITPSGDDPWSAAS